MTEIAKAYEPAEVESRWYPEWTARGCFRGSVDSAREPYSIVIPPPNVTGILHMGHLLNNTLQDMLVRRARQQGKAAVWLPGTDHAGIATQSRVERELREKEGLTRHDLGRERFFQRASDWRDEHGGLILEQLKRLGASCDWERSVHTLDPEYSRAVLTAFVRLYQKGNIYRGKRMVNWCPVSRTALSDEEVIMKPQKGLLYHMRYEVVDSPGEYVEIATTRPETLMGDAAVAVHPDDPRYRHLHGKQVWRPFPRAKIPLVLDTHVDREFGTGVLKVTPAHDPADWEIGQRHNLPAIDVFNPDATLNALAGDEFAGMDRFKARKVAARKLEEMGLLVRTEPYENNVGFSERADVPVEPRLSDQWWLKYPQVAEARKAVTDGRIRIYPERWVKTYLHWLDNIQDWCISRQLWWGHRIPVWYRKGIDRSRIEWDNPEHVHVSVDGPPDPENWEQEEDVLDTWASSWLWPFATFGWPGSEGEARRELEFWYPTSVLVTGFDIIFFWVARMIMAGLEFTGEVPFRAVYFNGLIRDSEGRKMSKSLGNSPDPIELIERFGADGLRLGLLMIAPKGQDILFSEERVQQGRNFCNKLWNAARFRQMQDSTAATAKHSLGAIVSGMDPALMDADDHAILGRLGQTVDRFVADFSAYEFHAATQTLYTFFWNDFCDWYVEVSKTRLKDADVRAHVLAIQDLCLRQLLLMLHPVTPFITEQLWHDLGFGPADDFIQNHDCGTGAELLSVLAQNGICPDADKIREIADLRDLVTKARALKAQYRLASRRDVTFFHVSDAARSAIIEANCQKLCSLCGASTFEARDSVKDAPAAVTELGTLYLDLSQSVDTGAERDRLVKERVKLDKAIQSAEAKLANPRFTDQAPEAVVAGVRSALAEHHERHAELTRLIKSLAG